MFLLNSRSHLVTATLLSLGSKSHHQKGRTFFRSYGANLPSSFTRVLLRALEFSSHLPVSVYGTVIYNLKLRDFSWKHGISDFTPVGVRHQVSALCTRIYLSTLPTLLNRNNPITGSLSLLRHPIAVINGTGILTCFPSNTHFCLFLGADSPYVDERCVGNLRFSARGILTPFIVTHVSILTSDTSSRPLDPPSTAYRTLPYPTIIPKDYSCRSFGTMLSPGTSSMQAN